MKKFNTILVTGGAGYVGVPLVDLLLKNGYKVRVLDMLRYGVQPILPLFAYENFEFQKGDVRNAEDVKKALSGVDAVIHLAAIVGYPACRKHPQMSREINVDGTRNVVSNLKEDVPIFFASTASNYGKMLEDLCTETTPLNPLTDYGRQKTEAEEIVKKHKNFVIYRFATAFGVAPRMRLDLLPNDFTYRAIKERTLVVYEKHFMRTFIHVRDMGQAFLFALHNYEKMRGEIYNVGDNKMNYSKEDICLLIQKRVDYYLHFADVGHDMDQRNYIISYDKLMNLGFKAKMTMEQGLDELVQVSHLIEFDNPYYNV